MIRGIRRRFIRIALAVLALAMILVVGIINAANWLNVRAELSETMSALSETGGQYGKFGGRNRHMRNMLDESRFFVVNVGADGATRFTNTSRVSDMDAEELDRIASKALQSGKTTGFCEDYMFSLSRRGEGGTILFLNCETKLTRVRRLALISALACGGCILLAWLLVALFSRRAIKPLVENAVMQKQFITDAGHELKTPLTVISANMDVLALETGENEWVRSTKKQVANMRGLVNELIYLSRLDEEDAKLKREDVDLSKLVREAAEPFIGMAEFSGKAMAVDVQDGVHLDGDGAALERLASILCDNAVKYAPEGDEIRAALRQGKRGIVFSVENGLKQPLSQDQLAHLFDRFYRTDESRNRESGGYGIGLSVARAIVEKHGGKLLAKQTEDGKRIAFVCRI
ncbi:MAG: HAMP domain-containing histidine kinase [Clostridia bacterium]|nr:HAMP domain-containing histidine kinase [Clostridia bacterium]